MNSVIKNIFLIVGIMIVAVALKEMLFGGNIIPLDKSAIYHASKAFEYPISDYYYQYSFYPSVALNEGMLRSLVENVCEGTVVQNLKPPLEGYSETNLSGKLNDKQYYIDNVEVMYSSVDSNKKIYSTGWR